MNERIRELAKEATRKYDRLGNEIPFAQPDLEKFAELIVRECMRLNSKELSITAIERLLPLYKEHFGVGE
jgi:hypothetical protein